MQFQVNERVRVLPGARYLAAAHVGETGVVRRYLARDRMPSALQKLNAGELVRLRELLTLLDASCAYEQTQK